MKGWSMALVFQLCGVLVLIYGVVCVGLRQWQTRLLFFPDAELKTLPDAVGLAYQDILIRLEDLNNPGTVNGWWIPVSDDQQALSAPVILYLHGNGSNLGDLTDTGQQFHLLGWNCLLIDYRGYGLSQGNFPTEESVYDDAEAAWTYLLDDLGFPPNQIVVYGHSLGGAIAIDLATRHPEMGGLIVEGSFTSMLDMATLEARYRLLPLDWIVTQRFESLSKVKSLVPPLLLLHGMADETVPYSMSQSLQIAAQESVHQPQTTLMLIPQAGHNDLPTIGGDSYIEALQDFIKGVIPLDVSMVRDS